MSFIKKIRENLKDPKKKSLTMLAMYAVFFIFVFVLINTGSNQNEIVPEIENEKNNSIINNYKNMTSYQYKMIFTDSGLQNILEGTYSSGLSLFNYNSNSYYVENNLLYFIDKNTYYLKDIPYNPIKFYNNNFYSILSNLKEYSKTEYNDGIIETKYYINAADFYKYYSNAEIYSDVEILISLKVSNNYISNIIIDLSSVSNQLSKIEIEYSNINSIKSIEFNKENYIYQDISNN